LVTFDDFWELGFKKENRKRCMEKWNSIPTEEYEGLLRYAKRFIKGKVGLARPYAFLNSNDWIKKAHSTNPKDYTQISDTLYRGYCSNCGKEVFPTKDGLKEETICCEADISPYRIVKKIITRKIDAS
jgi:hypothetical protein